MASLLFSVVAVVTLFSYPSSSYSTRFSLYHQDPLPADYSRQRWESEQQLDLLAGEEERPHRLIVVHSHGQCDSRTPEATSSSNKNSSNNSRAAKNSRNKTIEYLADIAMKKSSEDNSSTGTSKHADIFKTLYLSDLHIDIIEVGTGRVAEDLSSAAQFMACVDYSSVDMMRKYVDDDGEGENAGRYESNNALRDSMTRSAMSLDTLPVPDDPLFPLQWYLHDQQQFGVQAQIAMTTEGKITRERKRDKERYGRVMRV